MYIFFDVPDISEYQNGFPGYWLQILFISSVSENFQINALTTTYVRLVEAALVEYRLGQARLKEYWNTHTSINLSSMHRAASHFESCISDMHRAILCFRPLRRHKDLPDSLRQVLNAEKPRFIADHVSDQLREFRNAIHHLDQRVMKGLLQQGQPIALKPDGPEVPHPTEPNQTNKTIDRLVIAELELKFADLAAWLTEMGRFAEKFADYQGPR